jgi:hypothetical protein
METDATVLARLDRIDALDRRETPPAVLLAELRGLLHDAEACAASRAADGKEVAERRHPAPHGT